MHILITGAAGMIGRKLTERLGKDGALADKPIDKLTLLDVICPPKPEAFTGKVETVAADLAAPGEAAKAIAERPDVVFHLAGVVSGEAELDFDKGYRVNLDGTRALFEAIRADRRRLPAAARLHLVDRGVRRTVPAHDPRRFSSHAAHLLRRRRRRWGRRCLPTIAGAASATASAFACRPSWCGRASPTRPLRASSPASSASRSPGEDAVLPVAETVVHTHASPRAAVGFLVHAAALPRDAIAPRVNLSMPGVCCTVAEQIASLRRIAGDRVAARIRRAEDPLVARIVAGWPQRIEARRARELGFKAESSFDEIVRIHIEEDRGGSFVN